MPSYRKPLFNALRRRLMEDFVQLRVVHGKGDPRKPERPDDDILEWGEIVPARTVFGARSGVLWQGVGRAVREADLVILTQENRLLHSYWISAMRRIRRYRVGFWGHGRNFQNSGRLSEFWRSTMINVPDWWFAYTSLSKQAVVASGFPVERITVLDNAIDTQVLRKSIESVSELEKRELRSRLGVPDTAVVGVFCSSLHEGKKLDFLFRSADRIHEGFPGFHLLVIGDGPCRGLVDDRASKNPWIHWAGARFGTEKALWLSIADVFLMPFFVGLSILDAFCAGLPVVAVDPAHGQHSPEIAYLEDGRNGALTRNDPADYAAVVEGLLRDAKMRARLSQAAANSATKYTIENMADNFARGIRNALACH